MLRVNMRASVWIKNSKRYLTECRLRNKSYFDSGLKVNIVYVNNIDRCIIEGKSKKKNAINQNAYSMKRSNKSLMKCKIY